MNFKKFSGLLVLAFIFFFLAFPRTAHADPVKDPLAVDSLGIFSLGEEVFFDHFQTGDGHDINFIPVVLRANVQINRQWRLEIRHMRGTSATVNGFQASVGDFESRVAYRLDDYRTPSSEDSPWRRVYGWLSWKVWTSTDVFDGVTETERDEGLGIGISRVPATRALSYWYTAGLYPAVRRGDKFAESFLLDSGLVYRIAEPLFLTAGYRYQSFFSEGLPHERLQEQGFILGLRETF